MPLDPMIARPFVANPFAAFQEGRDMAMQREMNQMQMEQARNEMVNAPRREAEANRQRFMQIAAQVIPKAGDPVKRAEAFKGLLQYGMANGAPMDGIPTQYTPELDAVFAAMAPAPEKPGRPVMVDGPNGPMWSTPEEAVGQRAYVKPQTPSVTVNNGGGLPEGWAWNQPGNPGAGASRIPGLPQTVTDPPAKVAPQTPGQVALDKGFAKDYQQWRAAGGYADLEKQVAQLSTVLTNLEGPKGEGLTGKVLGAFPAGARVFAPNGEASVEAQQQVEEVVQRSLRAVLGAQFAQKEGDRLIARAYNPQLDAKTNATRVRRLLESILKMGQAKEAAAQYFEQNGTLEGWAGTIPSVGSLDAAISRPGEFKSSPGRDAAVERRSGAAKVQEALDYLNGGAP